MAIMTQEKKLNKELIQRTLLGDVEAFAELFREHFQPVYNYALSLCNDPASAEDLTQEAFIRAHANLERFGPPWNFRTWMFRLTRNYFIDLTRKERKVEPLEEGYNVLSTDPSPEKETLMNEVANKVQRTLQLLRAQHREILVLRELNGFSYTEISEVMNISGSNVKVLLHRARASFQETYGIRLLLEEPVEGCQEVTQLLNLLHDGESLYDRERFVKEHLKECDACQQRHRWLITQSAIFGSVIPIVPPSSLLERIFEETGLSKRLRKTRRARNLRRGLTYGSISGAIGAAVWLLISTFSSPGNNLPNPPGIGSNGSSPVPSDQPHSTSTATPPHSPNLPPLTLTPSLSPTPTNTANRDSIVFINQQILCWAGPGDRYEVISSIQPGTQVELLGTGQSGDYLVILNPRYGVACWVKEGDVDTNKLDLFSFPVFKTPPLPTHTPTATPQLGCLVPLAPGAGSKCEFPCPNPIIYPDTCTP